MVSRQTKPGQTATLPRHYCSPSLRPLAPKLKGKTRLVRARIPAHTCRLHTTLYPQSLPPLTKCTIFNDRTRRQRIILPATHKRPSMLPWPRTAPSRARSAARGTRPYNMPHTLRLSPALPHSGQRPASARALARPSTIADVCARASDRWSKPHSRTVWRVAVVQ